MIPKSYPDAAGSRGMVREKLVLVIQPQSSVDVDSRRYDLNGTNCYVQMKIHFVRDEIPTEDGKVQLKHNAAYPDGVEVATGELFFLHYELKAKGQMYLACGEEGKVTEVFIKQSTMTMHQNKEMNGGITGFFRRFIHLKSGHGDYGKPSYGRVGLLLRKFIWEYELCTFPAF